MVPFAGYNMPVRYTSDIEEHNTVRNGVGMFDVSHMGEFLVKGPNALDLIQKVTSNDASKLVIGKAQYSCLPNDKGGIVDDLLVYKIREEEYLLVVNASNIDKDWDWISSHNDMGAEMKNISDDFSLFAVQGPKAMETLQKLTSVNLSEIKFYNFEVGDFAGAEYVIISATGYTGAGGFEIYLHNKDAEMIWDKIMEAGEEFDIKPIGLGARDTLRMEMGYCLWNCPGYGLRCKAFCFAWSRYSHCSQCADVAFSAAEKECTGNRQKSNQVGGRNGMRTDYPLGRLRVPAI